MQQEFVNRSGWSGESRIGVPQAVTLSGCKGPEGEQEWVWVKTGKGVSDQEHNMCQGPESGGPCGSEPTYPPG